jgi:hypothetical protein
LLGNIGVTELKQPISHENTNMAHKRASKYALLALGLLASFSAIAESLWDLRAIANQPAPYTNLKRPDGSTYITINNGQAKMIKDITDKFSLQSGVYPAIKLRESSEINAMAGSRCAGSHLFS